MPYEGNAQEHFRLTQLFTAGYQNKLQLDEVEDGSMVNGSFNVIIDDDGKPRTRYGSRFLGTPLTALTGGTTSSARLRRRDGFEIPINSFSTYTRYLHPQQNALIGANGWPDWVILESGFTTDLQFGFATNDLNSDNFNKMVMCNGTDNYRIWNGAVDLVSQWSATTITTQSSFGLAAALFTPTGNIQLSTADKVRTFAYTGVSMGTFTGVTPDPNNGLDGSTPLVSGMAITQTPTQYASAPKGNVLLASDNARVLVANVLNSSGFAGGGAVYGSKTDDPTDFTFSSPRAATDGFIINIAEGGGNVTGMVQFEEDHYIFKPATVKDLTFSQDGNDIVQIRSKTAYDEKSSGDSGSVSALGVFKADNAIFFVSPTRTIQDIARVQTVDYPQSLPISDPIKALTDIIPFDTETAGIGWKGRAFVSCKEGTDSSTNDLQLVYNQRYSCWEPPWVGMPIASYFVYESNIYGTLATSPDTLQLWTGDQDYLSDLNQEVQDEGIPINSTFIFNKNTYGKKDVRKEFDQYYVEGEMAGNGSATFTVIYDDGAESRSGTLTGTQGQFFYSPSSIGPFGDQPFGVAPFGADPTSPSGAARFRLVLTTKRRPFYNIQFMIETANFFKIIAFGPNVKETSFKKPSTTYSALSS